MKLIHGLVELCIVYCSRNNLRFSFRWLKLSVQFANDPSDVNCDTCEKSFTSKSRLVSHKKFKHQPKDYSFTCNTCDKRSQNKDQHTVQRLTHTAEYPFNCSECNHHFKQKFTLLNHKKTHTLEKICCDICPKSYSRNADLKKTHYKEAWTSWNRTHRAGAGWSLAGWSAAGWSAAGWSAAGWSAAGWSAARWSAAGWSAAGWWAAGWSAAGGQSGNFSLGLNHFNEKSAFFSPQAIQHVMCSIASNREWRDLWLKGTQIGPINL